MPTIVHAADLHLDSPLSGLAEYDGAPVGEIRSATRRALAGLVDVCLEEEAQLLLIAGDLYDGDFRDYSTALFFIEQMARLQEAGVQVVWLRGNHDAANVMTKHLRSLDSVRELSHQRTESVAFEDLGVVVHGQGYATRDVKDNLAAGYPAPLSGLVNIGLLHTALDGRPGHAPYAPCTLAQLTAHGYDYWALGHVHQREILSEHPWVVFPGNLQGRHAKETGPKGVTVIEVDDAGISRVRSRVVDVVRWEVAEIDVGSCQGMLDVVDRAAARIDELSAEAGGRVLSTRVILKGRSQAHGELVSDLARLEMELRAHAIERGDVYLERIVVETQGQLGARELAQRRDALGDLFRSLDELAGDEEALAELRREVLDPLSAQAADLLRDEGIDFAEVLGEASRLLEGRLIEAPEQGDA